MSPGRTSPRGLHVPVTCVCKCMFLGKEGGRACETDMDRPTLVIFCVVLVGICHGKKKDGPRIGSGHGLDAAKAA